VQGLGWRLVRIGVGLTYLGLRLLLVAVVLGLFAGGTMVGSLFLPPAADPQSTNGAVIACWIMAGILAAVAVLFASISSIVSLIGWLLCCAMPEGTVARACIWGSVLCALVAAVAGGVGGASSKPAAADKPPDSITRGGDTLPAAPGEETARAMETVDQVLRVALPILAALGAALAVGVGANVLSNLLWLLFLRQLGCLLGEIRLARGVVRFVIFLCVWPLLWGCGSGIMSLVVWLTNTASPAAMPWLVGAPSGLCLLLLVVSFFWYFALLRRTALLLRRAVPTAVASVPA
jgi:hypothetical protein